MVKIRSKIWLERNDGEKIFGDGPYQLLEKINDLGSLKKAAESIGMSYAQAWEIMNMIEKNLGYPLLAKQIGGQSGGGSHLTTKGKPVLKAYKEFRKEITKSMDRIYQEKFQGINLLK